MRSRLGIAQKTDPDKLAVSGCEVLRRMGSPEYLPNHCVSRIIRKNRESLQGYLNTLREYLPDGLEEKQPRLSYFSSLTEREFLLF